MIYIKISHYKKGIKYLEYFNNDLNYLKKEKNFYIKNGWKFNIIGCDNK